jgi:DNA-binding XRE family transcriptional regulator
MDVQFKKTPDGEVAIVPRAEYERLVRLAEEAEEDAGTARIVARAKREVADGVPLLPKAVVDRLAKGENPIRVLREWRDRTQAELAVAVGIGQGYLSDLETGKRKGPFELHHKLAGALGIPFDLLAPIGITLEKAEPGRVIKRRQVIAKMKRARRQP